MSRLVEAFCLTPRGVPPAPPGDPETRRSEATGRRGPVASKHVTEEAAAPARPLFPRDPRGQDQPDPVARRQCFGAELQASHQHAVLQPAWRGPLLTLLPRDLLRPSPGAYMLRIPGGRARGGGGGRVLVPLPSRPGLTSASARPALPHPGWPVRPSVLQARLGVLGGFGARDCWPPGLEALASGYGAR